MDALFTLLFASAIGLELVGGIWLALLAYNDSSTTPWMVWLFPVYELAYGFRNLKKAKYPMLILLAGAVAYGLAYSISPWY